MLPRARSSAPRSIGADEKQRAGEHQLVASLSVRHPLSLREREEELSTWPARPPAEGGPTQRACKKVALRRGGHVTRDRYVAPGSTIGRGAAGLTLPRLSVLGGPAPAAAEGRARSSRYCPIVSARIRAAAVRSPL